VVFAPPEQTLPVDPAAYELYLKATELLAGSFTDLQAWKTALSLLEQATSLAPKFARAWAALATNRLLLFRSHGTDEPYPAMRAKVVKAAETALALDPESGAASLALAGFEPLARYAERQALIEEALSRSPNDLDLIAAAAGFCGAVGRTRDALALAKQGFDLDPLNMQVANIYAIWLAQVGRYVESRELLDRLLNIWPQAPVLLNNAIGFAGSAGDWDRIEALVHLAKARGLYGDRVRQFAEFARNLRTKDAGYAARFLGYARGQLSRTGNVPEIVFANLCQVGLVDEAFELMDEASFDYVLDAEKPRPGAFNSSYILSPALSLELIRDPRFPRLCAKLRLCDYWVKTDRWPDLADENVTPYDFKAACRRLAADA
jgi:tetratricopeptide (TPR) repeat protein